MARNTSDKSVSHPISGMITSFEAVKVTAISGRSFTVFGGIGEYMFCGQLPTYEKRIEEVDIDRGNLPTIVFWDTTERYEQKHSLRKSGVEGSSTMQQAI